MLLRTTLLLPQAEEEAQGNHHQEHRPADMQSPLIYARLRNHSQGHQARKHHLPKRTLLSTQGLIKICDFGWSISSKTMRETFCGTPLYVSPELLKKKNYNNKIDVWSVGILTYELLFGRVPFEITNEQDFIKIVDIILC